MKQPRESFHLASVLPSFHLKDVHDSVATLLVSVRNFIDDVPEC